MRPHMGLRIHFGKFFLSLYELYQVIKRRKVSVSKTSMKKKFPTTLSLQIYLIKVNKQLSPLKCLVLNILENKR